MPLHNAGFGWTFIRKGYHKVSAKAGPVSICLEVFFGCWSNACASRLSGPCIPAAHRSLRPWRRLAAPCHDDLDALTSHPVGVASPMIRTGSAYPRFRLLAGTTHTCINNGLHGDFVGISTARSSSSTFFQSFAPHMNASSRPQPMEADPGARRPRLPADSG